MISGVIGSSGGGKQGEHVVHGVTAVSLHALGSEFGYSYEDQAGFVRSKSNRWFVDRTLGATTVAKVRLGLDQQTVAIVAGLPDVLSGDRDLIDATHILQYTDVHGQVEVAASERVTVRLGAWHPVFKFRALWEGDQIHIRDLLTMGASVRSMRQQRVLGITGAFKLQPEVYVQAQGEGGSLRLGYSFSSGELGISVGCGC
ncbi:hypothetical protein ABPG75_000276 [Micractinium tetrahymenae]